MLKNYAGRVGCGGGKCEQEFLEQRENIHVEELRKHGDVEGVNVNNKISNEGGELSSGEGSAVKWV